MYSSQYVAEDDLELLVLLFLSYECHGNMYVTTFSLCCAGIKPKASCTLDLHSLHTELHPQAPYLQIPVLIIQGKVLLMVESRELKIKGSNTQWKACCCRSGNGVWRLTLPSLRGLDSETITQSLRLSDREVRRHSNTVIQQIWAAVTAPWDVCQTLSIWSAVDSVFSRCYFSPVSYATGFLLFLPPGSANNCGFPPWHLQCFFPSWDQKGSYYLHRSWSHPFICRKKIGSMNFRLGGDSRGWG